jgi:hypothetical protein
MYRIWNACNLRFNICAGEWKNDSIETNGYAIDLPIGASKWNMCELLVKFRYRRVSKGTIEKEILCFAITLMVLFNVALFCEPSDEAMELPAYLWCHLPLRGIIPREVKMMKQMSFKLNENVELQMLWNGLPESNQKEIKRLYAKLIAQAAKSEIRAEAKEKGEGDVE